MLQLPPDSWVTFSCGQLYWLLHQETSIQFLKLFLLCLQLLTAWFLTGHHCCCSICFDFASVLTFWGVPIHMLQTRHTLGRQHRHRERVSVAVLPPPISTADSLYSLQHKAENVQLYLGLLAWVKGQRSYGTFSNMAASGSFNSWWHYFETRLKHVLWKSLTGKEAVSEREAFTVFVAPGGISPKCFLAAAPIFTSARD